MNLKDYWPVALENIGIFAVFGGVAVIFHHWWIVLFAFAAMSTVKTKETL